MLPAFKGRIDRKTFILGNMVGLGALGLVGLIYIVPVAIIDIIVTSVAKFTAAQPVFQTLYALFLIPAIFYFFFFSVLFVKRVHDIGYPGMLILWTVIGSLVLSRVMDIFLLNILGLLIVAAVCLMPGQKERNSFGPKPHKKFKIHSLTVKF